LLAYRKALEKEKENVPHGLDSVGINDLLVSLPFWIAVAAVIDELHLLQKGRLQDVD
jgi:hypothetical protein